LREHVFFFSKFLRKPVSIGAVTPSSDELAHAITDGIHIESARSVLELGPGTGVFTRAILRRAAPAAQLVAVEIDPTFAQVVRDTCPRVQVVNGPAERLPEYVAAGTVDCIVSGLPWAIFSDDQQTRILEAITTVLRPNGWFATFAYSHAAWLPAGRRFRHRLDHTFKTIRRTPIIWKNLPPAFVYRCQK
jgi:phospholipid N-methyltransferase